MGEALVEDARLHGEGSLRGKHLGFEIVESAQGKRAEPKGDQKSKQRGANRHHANRNEQAAQADAGGIQSGYFAIGRKASKPNQYAHQSSHRKRKSQHWRK